MYCGRFVGPSRTAHGWSPCFIKITHARWIKIEPFALTVYTHTHTIFHTHTHHLSHTHNFVTHIIFLCHTPFFTYNIIQLCHTQLFFTSWSSTTSFVFPSFPVPATTFGAHYWKKLPCGVIRSFNLANIKHAMLSQYAAALAWASAQGARTEQNRWATPVPHLSFPFDCCCLPFLR